MFERVFGGKVWRRIAFDRIRSFSINQRQLVSSSANLQLILRGVNEQCALLSSIEEIHQTYPAEWPVATSTKNLYQMHSSKFNSDFQRLENERREQVEFFARDQPRELLILLRYLRYLNLSSIYRLITYDIQSALKQTSEAILRLCKHSTSFQSNDLSLLCELLFYLNYLSSTKSLSQLKSDFWERKIGDYFFAHLPAYLSRSDSHLFIEEFARTFYSLNELPKRSAIGWYSSRFLQYLFEHRLADLRILKYLIFLEHHRDHRKSSARVSLLNDYLNEVGLDQNRADVLCELLVLICAWNYSHQSFQKHLQQQIEQWLHNPQPSNPLNEMELACRLISYLCFTDPTNRFQSRSMIIQLSGKVCANLRAGLHSPQWLVQAQHAMMLVNLYNYELLFSTVQTKHFPLLFRDLGVYSSTLHRQLFDLHHVLPVDRPSLANRLLNPPMLRFVTKISEEYRSSIRSSQRSYYDYCNELKESFQQLYGEDSCEVIDTSRCYPYLLFDFLQLTLPADQEHFQAIGIPSKQRIAILPILTSMLIKQQRSDGSLVCVLSAQTTMRYRLIEKNNYQVLPIFHEEYIRAVRRNNFQSMFETKLALKTPPEQALPN